MIKTDYHCHVIPAFDDGAKNREMSEKMLDMMCEQGIENIVLTPHFYMHKEKSVNDFLKRRETAFADISDRNFNFYPGAEVALERGICELPDIEKLAIQGTDLILLELPFSNTGRWIHDEIHNLVCETGLTPIFAHIHRYTDVLSKDDMKRFCICCFMPYSGGDHRAHCFSDRPGNRRCHRPGNRSRLSLQAYLSSAQRHCPGLCGRGHAVRCNPWIDFASHFLFR